MGYCSVLHPPRRKQAIVHTGNCPCKRMYVPHICQRMHLHGCVSMLHISDAPIYGVRSNSQKMYKTLVYTLVNGNI